MFTCFSRICHLAKLLRLVLGGSRHYGKRHFRWSTRGVTVRGETIVFPVTLQPGWYLEYTEGDVVRVFDPNGFTKAEVRPRGRVPTIASGKNPISFFCDPGKTRGQTVKVRFVTRGKPLR